MLEKGRMCTSSGGCEYRGRHFRVLKSGGCEYQPPLSDESGVAAGSHSRHLGPKWRPVLSAATFGPRMAAGTHSRHSWSKMAAGTVRRDGPLRGPVPNQTPLTPKPEVASQYHTVISRARHLPWEPGRAGQQSGCWTREGSPHQTSRHGRARAEHGAGATLEVAR